jgi:hypothetical protein
MFHSEGESEDQARDWTPPPTGYRPVVPEEIRQTGQRSTGLLIGASVMLLSALLGVVLTRDRQHLFPRPPLDLTPPAAQSSAATDRAKETDTTPPAAAAPVVPATGSEPTRETAEAPVATTIAPDTAVELLAAATPPPAAIVIEAPARSPDLTPATEPLQPETTNAAPPAAPPAPAMTSRPALDDIAAGAVLPPPPPAPPPDAATVDPLTGDQAAIRRTLDVYRESYSALDASAVSMIWVGLDTKALQRAFSTLSRQDLEFDHCDLDISAARNKARASCTGVLNYVRRIGSADEHQRQLSWAIDLVRSSDRWLIQNVTAR